MGITESVYMAQTQGFNHPYFPHHVCHLGKAIYGLKQAPLSCFHKLSQQLLALEFTASKVDTSLFIYYKTAVEIFVLIYVDDILVTDSIAAAIDAHSKLGLCSID